MAHFAKIINGTVIDVIVADPEFFETFVDSSPGKWLQTSYNTRGGIHYGQDGEPDSEIALRKNYAVIGMIYDGDRDAFYFPQPYASWILNEDSCLWEAPTPIPDDGNEYAWNEDNQSWDEVE